MAPPCFVLVAPLVRSGQRELRRSCWRSADPTSRRCVPQARPRAQPVRAVTQPAGSRETGARPTKRGTVLVTGKFDAFHSGHRALVARAVELGHPTLLSFSGMAEALRWTPRAPVVAAVERARILREWGFSLSASVGYRTLRFADVRDMPPAEFLDFVQTKLGATAVVCGPDWRFGAGAAGDVPLLRKLTEERGMRAEVVDPVLFDDEPVSSTRVRDAIERGDVELAAKLMDRPHRLVGVVSSLTTDTVSCTSFVNQVPGEGMYSALIRVIGAAQPVRSYVQVAYPQLMATAESGPGQSSTSSVPIVTIYDATQIYCDDCEVYIDFTARMR